MDAPKITEPGVYDIPADAYHADPVAGGSLSSTGARLLVNASPATFRWREDNPQPPKRIFDFGHVAHRLVLGRGDRIKVIAHPSYKTKAARELRDAAYADGRIPILAAEFDAAQAMADAIWNHPFAGALFRDGSPERTLVWRDEEFGVWRRCRPDWLPVNGAIVPDYKTAASARPEDLARAMDNLGYYQQAAWYLDGVTALGLHDAPRFVFVFQEKEPPYQVVVAQPDTHAVEWGRIKNRKALDVFRRCSESGRWPGYADEVISLELPYYAELRLTRDHEMGLFDVAHEFYRPLEEGDAA